MNLILNSYCNLKCNYCFADEYMEGAVKTPGKSMDYDFFMHEILPKIKNAAVVNFMGGEPTLHPQFNGIFSNTLNAMQAYAGLGIFTNGLMPDRALALLQQAAGRDGSVKRQIRFSVLLNWQTPENTTERNHERCRHTAVTLLKTNGYCVTFSINLYSKNQDLYKQCREIDETYQAVGLPQDQRYKVRVSPAFPIVGNADNVYLPIRDYPKAGRAMIDILKKFPQMDFRFDCSFPPCFLDEIREEEYSLVERFFFHGFKPVPAIQEWKTQDLYFGCADGSPMDIDPSGDCFNCFPFHGKKLGNAKDFKEVNTIATARMGSRFLASVFDETQVKEPCKSCPHHMIRCSTGCFAYNFI